MATTCKYIGPSKKYKGVSIKMTKKGVYKYQANLGCTSKFFNNERDAAKYYDLWRIKEGKEPVNVLIRKN